MICPRCGTENPDGAKFCNECASPLGATTNVREERKVVSVLFADLVGFTARAEKLDPEEVQRVLQPYHALVRGELERYGGTVEKFIGDAVMAVFGAPVAREDDPERAVRAALAIRDAVAGSDLSVRIGVTTGEALVSLGARPEAGEGMVAGDVVNTAARLQVAAPVNEALVDEATRRATDTAIEYADHPAVEAKGKDQPVPAWRAVRARSRYGVDVRQHGAAPLVGRSAELALLVEALARARSEREPQLVTLVGVPGIGKSRLVWELFQTVHDDPAPIRWRQGRSLPYAEGVSLWALGEIVKAEAGILDTDDESGTSVKLKDAVAALISDANEARWVDSHLRPLVGIEEQVELRVAPRAERFSAWRRFLEAAAEQHPLVIVLEDLQWADDDLLDFVDHLVDWARGVPILAIATARPELLGRRPGWGGGKANSVTRSLAALSDEETADLVRTRLGRSLLDADLQATLLERAGGNPLYAEEISRLVAEGQRIDDLPSTLQGAIAARLDALTPEEKALLQDAAVVGKVFWLGALTAIGGIPRWTAEERLHDLERKEFVRRERQSSVAAEPEFAFRHLLVRDVAYGQIPRARRADRHRLAAEWIESLGRAEDHAEMLAHHYLSALEYRRASGGSTDRLAEPARRALEAAGLRANSLNAWPAAIRYFRAAIESTPESHPSFPRLLLGLGRALHATADPESGRTLERVAAAPHAGPDEAGTAEALLANLSWYEGRRDEAVRHIEQARRLLGDRAAPQALAAVLSELSRLLMLRGDDEEAVTVGREALAIAEPLGLDEVRAAVLDNIGVSRLISGDPAGREDLERAIEIGLASSMSEAARAYNNLGFLGFEMGDLQLERAMRRESRRLSERIGPTTLQFVLGADIQHAYFSGEWNSALTMAEGHLEDTSASGYIKGLTHAVSVNIRFARGDTAGAEAGLTAALALSEEAGDPQIVVPVLAVAMEVDLQSGRRRDAIARAEELFALLGRRPARFDAFVDLALAASELGLTDRVRDLLTRVRMRSLWVEAARLIVDGDLLAGADVLMGIGDRTREAIARARAAGELRAAGHPREADEQSGRALTFWRSVGATRYLESVEGSRAIAS